MYRSWASSEAIRKSMQGNRGRDTKPELAVRRLVHAAGLRYRVNARPERDLRRTADMLFTRARIVVFIDGCYWHGAPSAPRFPQRTRSIGRPSCSETGVEMSRRRRSWKREDGWYCASGSMRTQQMSLIALSGRCAASVRPSAELASHESRSARWLDASVIPNTETRHSPSSAETNLAETDGRPACFIAHECLLSVAL